MRGSETARATLLLVVAAALSSFTARASEMHALDGHRRLLGGKLSLPDGQVVADNRRMKLHSTSNADRRRALLEEGDDLSLPDGASDVCPGWLTEYAEWHAANKNAPDATYLATYCTETQECNGVGE
jgi:hypothetical protein